MKLLTAKIMHYLVAFTSGAGIGSILCKLLGENEWSWTGWSRKHKIIYGVVSSIIAIPMIIYLCEAHFAYRDKIAEEDDE